MAKVYITKYALSTGIEKVNTDLYRSSIGNRYYIRAGYNCYFIGVDAFTIESQAIEKAEEMRIKKIASLKKKIEKLEKLNFKKEE